MMTGFVKELKGLMRELFDQEQEIKALKDRVNEFDIEVSELIEENDLIEGKYKDLQNFLNETIRGEELLCRFDGLFGIKVFNSRWAGK